MSEAGKNFTNPSSIQKACKTAIITASVHENEHFRAKNHRFAHHACNQFLQLMVYSTVIYMNVTIVNKKGDQYHHYWITFVT